MKIIISPAKNINEENDFNYSLSSIPQYLDSAIKLYDLLQALSIDEIKKYYKVSDILANKTFNNIHRYDINHGFLNALFTYDGIQYKELKANVLDDSALNYLNEHLCILSGLYGILRPFDLIIPYRLEMGIKVKDLNLYDYWHDLSKYFEDDDYLINLASNEYANAIIPHLKKTEVIDIIFLNDGKIKATYAKKARGAMVRYMAINKITKPQDLIYFNDLGYRYDANLSNESIYFFTKSQ